MFRRTVMFWVAAAASFGVPYSYYDPSVRETANSYWNKATDLWPSGEAAPAASIDGEGKPQTANSGLSAPTNVAAKGNSGPTSAPVFQQLDHVINFHANPRWVMDTWPRVSTTLSDTQLEGMRVPLVSGSRIDDIAGSLTYYFDKDKVLQRITFHGSTGDERRLVAMLTQHYKFESEPTVAGSLYMVKWNGDPVSVLRVEPAPVINQNLPHARLKIDLEINRPSRYYSLSPEMAQLVERDKHAGRWGFK
ncbi:DUF6690 family protein [Bremerella sp. T1]|uniref:DUF6690 family protein n=1 Tax=Bremerella sp. TYQ1 TaxID=3119568 RepID=UPI001CCD8D79|nr:DUF6690 family protein [Bremerella volcania]UBM37825.1 hypothetical protein LA756_08010 [Bremerella volcania]